MPRNPGCSPERPWRGVVIDWRLQLHKPPFLLRPAGPCVQAGTFSEVESLLGDGTMAPQSSLQGGARPARAPATQSLGLWADWGFPVLSRRERLSGGQGPGQRSGLGHWLCHQQTSVLSSLLSPAVSSQVRLCFQRGHGEISTSGCGQSAPEPACFGSLVLGVSVLEGVSGGPC